MAEAVSRVSSWEAWPRTSYTRGFLPRARDKDVGDLDSLAHGRAYILCLPKNLIRYDRLILLFRSVPNDDIKLRQLLNKFGLIERLTPYVAGGRGAAPKRRSKGVAGETTKRGDR